MGFKALAMDGTPLGCAETRLVRISLHIDGSMQHVVPQWLPLAGCDFFTQYGPNT
jgi:uncharacterized metal-binding protein